MRGRSAPFVVLLVVLLAAAGPVAAAGPGPDRPVGSAAGAAVAAGASEELRAVQELRLTPERPGEIEVRLRYEVPDRVTAITARLPAGATVESTDGFDAESAAEYEWDGRTDAPAITYRLAVNVTGEVSGPEGADGRYRFVDVGDWALIQRPRVGTGWRWTGSGRVELSLNTTVDGPGAVGGATAFLGEHRERRSSAHGQTFRLIVPAAADLEEPPEAILDALEGAAGALRVGARDDDVFVVAAPSDAVEWGIRGLQTGEADVWVLDDERLDHPGDTWTHEYVHTRQSFETTATTAWLTEATATYFAALFALEGGRVPFDAVARWLSLGARSPSGDAVLANPATWGGSRPDYHKGALVVGELDRRLRVETEHERTVQAIVRRLNEHDGPVNGSDFLGIVGSVGDDDLRAAAERYTTTSASPEMWDREAHERAFGPSPALIETALADRHRIGGPYRNATAGGDRVVLAVGETISLDAVVENAGGTAGPFEVAFGVDGTVEENRTGRLDPGEATTLTFDRTFEETGTFDLAAGGDRLTVEVVEPATPRLVDVAVSPTTVRPGESVTLSATVRNDAAVPGEREIAVARDGVVLGNRTVRLAPGETRTVSFSATLPEPGEYRLAVEDRTVLVTAESTPTPGATATDGVPGGGVPAAPGTLGSGLAGALLVIALLVLLRRWRRPPSRR